MVLFDLHCIDMNVLDVIIELIVGDGDVGGFFELFLHIRDLGLVDVDFGGLGKLSDEGQGRLVHQSAGEPQEGLLEIVIGAGGKIVILQITLAVELNVLGLNLSVLNVDLVSDQDNGNVLTHTHDISVPVGNVLVGDTRGDVKHDNGALALDVVSVTKTTELFLTCCVPYVEDQITAICAELERMDFHTECGDILLLELTGQMALDKCGLADTTISDKHKLEFRHLLGLHVEICIFNLFSI